jgi:hypothetical protein
VYMWQMVLVIQLTVSWPGWIGTESTVQYNKYHLPHIYILPSDDGLLIRLKNVEV